MATVRSVQKELAELRKDLSGIKTDYARLKRRAGATKADGLSRSDSIIDGLLGAMGAFGSMKERVADSANGALDVVSDQFGELGDVVTDYSERAGKTVAAHPFVAIASAAALGYIIARLSR